VHVAGDLVLPDQAAAEQQRVVRPERHRYAGLEKDPDRDRGRAGGDAERHVGGRADLAGDTPLGEPLDQLRILHRPHAMPEPVSVQQVQAGGHAVRTD